MVMMATTMGRAGGHLLQHLRERGDGGRRAGLRRRLRVTRILRGRAEQRLQAGRSRGNRRNRHINLLDRHTPRRPGKNCLMPTQNVTLSDLPWLNITNLIPRSSLPRD